MKSHQLNDYIRYLLNRNNSSEKEIHTFMNSFWLDMQMTGQALQTIKKNNSLWKKFEKKLENYSFGVVIINSLQQL